MPDLDYDAEAARIAAELPRGPRVVIIGSSAFWHDQSLETSAALGKLLAGLPELVLITGGVGGAGESVGRAFDAAARARGSSAEVYHILPHHEFTWDYGRTLYAGQNMADRREVLGRLASLYIVIEGGPGTVHEARVALARQAWILPIGWLGGCAGDLHAELECPAGLDRALWGCLGDPASSPTDSAQAVWELTRDLIERGALA
ncbi:MAG: hypothetical protein JSS02_22120 [Planctomycetes bacterium]|nr:hypothetical protein [Planctomycetota bacterium]